MKHIKLSIDQVRQEAITSYELLEKLGSKPSVTLEQFTTSMIQDKEVKGELKGTRSFTPKETLIGDYISKNIDSLSEFKTSDLKKLESNLTQLTTTIKTINSFKSIIESVGMKLESGAFDFERVSPNWASKKKVDNSKVDNTDN